MNSYLTPLDFSTVFSKYDNGIFNAVYLLSFKYCYKAENKVLFFLVGAATVHSMLVYEVLDYSVISSIFKLHLSFVS